MEVALQQASDVWKELFVASAPAAGLSDVPAASIGPTQVVTGQHGMDEGHITIPTQDLAQAAAARDANLNDGLGPDDEFGLNAIPFADDAKAADVVDRDLVHKTWEERAEAAELERVRAINAAKAQREAAAEAAAAAAATAASKTKPGKAEALKRWLNRKRSGEADLDLPDLPLPGAEEDQEPPSKPPAKLPVQTQVPVDEQEKAEALAAKAFAERVANGNAGILEKATAAVANWFRQAAEATGLRKTGTIKLPPTINVPGLGDVDTKQEDLDFGDNPWFEAAPKEEEEAPAAKLTPEEKKKEFVGNMKYVILEPRKQAERHWRKSGAKTPGVGGILQLEEDYAKADIGAAAPPVLKKAAVLRRILMIPKLESYLGHQYEDDVKDGLPLGISVQANLEEVLKPVLGKKEAARIANAFDDGSLTPEGAVAVMEHAFNALTKHLPIEELGIRRVTDASPDRPETPAFRNGKDGEDGWPDTHLDDQLMLEDGVVGEGRRGRVRGGSGPACTNMMLHGPPQPPPPPQPLTGSGGGVGDPVGQRYRLDPTPARVRSNAKDWARARNPMGIGKATPPASKRPKKLMTDWTEMPQGRRALDARMQDVRVFGYQSYAPFKG